MRKGIRGINKMFNFIKISEDFKNKAKEIYKEERLPKKKNYNELWVGYFTFQPGSRSGNVTKKKK